MEKLTAENYKKGFLIDEELMAGIAETPDAPGFFNAYVVRHTTGEVLGSQNYSDVFEAIRALNGIERTWKYEAISKCGNGNCGTGSCGKNGKCGSKKSQPSEESCSTGVCNNE